MNTSVIRLAALFITVPALHVVAQGNFKIYIDYDRRPVDSAQAAFRVVYYQDPDTAKQAGKIRTTQMNGVLVKTEEYSSGADGKRYEKETYYYGNGKVALLSQSLDGESDGEQLAYHPNGKLKRKAVYSKGKMANETCYTDQGKKDTACVNAPYENQQPYWPDGLPGLQKYIASVMVYPKDAKAQGIKGTVELAVIVDRLGKPGKPQLTKSVNPLLDAEAIRILSEMPAWQPGIQRDKLLPRYVLVPVKFE